MYVHRRANWEFFIVLEGRCSPRLAGRRLPLCTRHLWVFPPETAHGWRGERTHGCRVAIYHFSSVPVVMRQATEGRGYLAIPLSSDEARVLDRETRNLLPHYQHLTARSDLLFGRALLDMCLLALGALPTESLKTDQGLAARKVEACLSWFSEHMSRRPKLPEIARSVHLSVRHLRRLFMAVRGESPQKAFTTLRVERALELLAAQDDHLDDVAAACGFASTSDFCRVFRQHRGISPHAWRCRRLKTCGTVAAIP